MTEVRYSLTWHVAVLMFRVNSRLGSRGRPRLDSTIVEDEDNRRLERNCGEFYTATFDIVLRRHDAAECIMVESLPQRCKPVDERGA